MSQNNIGEFIQQSRKAKGFTQKDLGDRIGVSDKTISKWENGNSIPDTSILNELCATLDINVNELLSGEKLTPEIYSMKAEENMMNLLEDNQKTTVLYTPSLCSGYRFTDPYRTVCNIYACALTGYAGSLGFSNTPHLHRNLLLPCFIERKAT